MGKKKLKNWQYQSKPKHDPGLMAAIEMANYQLQVRKKAIRTLEINREIQKHTQKHRIDVEDEYTDWLYGCFALALHRKYRYRAQTIANIFDLIQETKNELIAEGVDHVKIWDMVRDEIGLDITVD